MIGRYSRNDGVALIAALLAMTILMTLGSGMILLTVLETRIASFHRDSIQTLYAAETGIEAVLLEIATVGDPSSFEGESTQSFLVDGKVGMRVLPDGSVLDLRSSKPPEGDREWHLRAHASLEAMTGGLATDTVSYIVVWLAEHSGENHLGLTLFATAFGPRGARRSVEVDVTRSAPGPGDALSTIDRLTWRER